MSKDIDYLIKKGWLPEENREKELKSRLSQFDADTYFRPDPLVRIQETALSLMESDQEEEKYRNIPVGLLSTLTMNGFAIRTPFGGKAIALNCTLWLHLINLFYCFQGVCLRNSNISIGSHHPDKTYFINIYNMIKIINSNNTLLIMVEGGENSLADVLGPASKPVKSVIDTLNRAMVFIMLHEYGHIAHGHLDDESTKKSMLGNNEAEVYSTEHLQEYEADEFAAKRVWGTDELSFMDNVATSLAVTQFFFILYFSELFLGENISRSHPPALERLNKILEIWERMTPPHQWSQIYVALDFQITGLRYIENNIINLAKG